MPQNNSILLSIQQWLEISAKCVIGEKEALQKFKSEEEIALCSSGRIKGIFVFTGN